MRIRGTFNAVARAIAGGSQRARSEENMRISSSFSVRGVSRILVVLLLVAGAAALVGGAKRPYSPLSLIHI